MDCKYRHALPPGFVLKSEKKALDELAKKDVISLEDFVETEVSSARPSKQRANLDFDNSPTSLAATQAEGTVHPGDARDLCNLVEAARRQEGCRGRCRSEGQGHSTSGGTCQRNEWTTHVRVWWGSGRRGGFRLQAPICPLMESVWLTVHCNYVHSIP